MDMEVESMAKEDWFGNEVEEQEKPLSKVEKAVLTVVICLVLAICWIFSK